jgi:hypothetical protein
MAKANVNADIFEIHAVSGKMIRDTGKRLDEALKQFAGKIDHELLLTTMEDLMAGKFTTGDLAAVYSHRLAKQARNG